MMKRNFLWFVLAGFVLFIGASLASAQVEQPPANESGWGLRFGWTPAAYSVDLKTESVPVHPDDASFLHGNTDVQVGSDIDWACFTLGVEKSFTIDGWSGDRWSIRPKVGFDGEFSLVSVQSQSNDGSRSSFYDFKQQSSDTRPASSGSFVYDKFAPGIFTPIPFVGVDFQRDNWVLSAEVGLSYKELKREFGWNRFGQEQAFGSNDEWCPSARPAIEVKYRFSEQSSLGAFAAYEWYSPSFGSVKAISFGIKFQFDF